MKTITIKNIEFKYKRCARVSEYDECIITVFYNGYKTKTFKKYLLFGKLITKNYPIEIFRVNIDIEDPQYTKDEIKDILERHFDRTYGQIDRLKEIQAGNII